MSRPKFYETSGAWSRDERGLFFLPGTAPRRRGSEASPHYHLEHHNAMLIAVNEMAENRNTLDRLDATLDEGAAHVLIDSGVFWLATRHADAHHLTMDQALSVAPDELDNFDWLWDHYLSIFERFGDRAWGVVELDQGGRENKIKTRRRLHRKGYHPIPVYHPLNDGWDYFDYLAVRYDRICVGNVVQAPAYMRRRILATIWQRKQAKYPNLWVHVLGYHPNEILNAYPLDSCDASTWLQGVRFGSHKTRACQASFGGMPKDFNYPRDEKNALYEKAVRAGAFSVHAQWLNWNHYHERLTAL